MKLVEGKKAVKIIVIIIQNIALILHIHYNYNNNNNRAFGAWLFHCHTGRKIYNPKYERVFSHIRIGVKCNVCVESDELI